MLNIQLFCNSSTTYPLAKWLLCIQREHLQTWHPPFSGGKNSVLHRSCLWPSGTAGPHHCRSIRDAGAGLRTGMAAPHYSYRSLLAGPLVARSCHGMGALWVSLYQVCPWHAPLLFFSAFTPPPPAFPPPRRRESRLSGWGTGGASWCQLRREISKVADTCPSLCPQLPQCIWCSPADPSWGNEALTLRRNAPSDALREALIAERQHCQMTLGSAVVYFNIMAQRVFWLNFLLLLWGASPPSPFWLCHDQSVEDLRMNLKDRSCKYVTNSGIRVWNLTT